MANQFVQVCLQWAVILSSLLLQTRNMGTYMTISIGGCLGEIVFCAYNI